MPLSTVILKSRNAAKLGTIAAINAPVQFSLGDVSATYGGRLNIIAVGGAVTGPTWVLEGSLDGGTTWFTVPAISSGFGVSGLVSGDTAALVANRYDVAGMAGMLFKFGATAGTGWTATTVYASVG